MQKAGRARARHYRTCARHRAQRLQLVNPSGAPSLSRHRRAAEARALELAAKPEGLRQRARRALLVAAAAHPAKHAQAFAPMRSCVALARPRAGCAAATAAAFFLLAALATRAGGVVSDGAARAQARFELVAQTDAGGAAATSAGRRCPLSIEHELVQRYANVTVDGGEADAVRFFDLVVEDARCNGSEFALTSTVFAERSPSPGGTPVATAEMWFLVGVDNSARRCERFRADNPAEYFFTDQLSTFRERMERERLIPRGVDALSTANDSRVYMLSRQFRSGDPASVDFTDDLVCTYIAPEEVKGVISSDDREEPEGTGEDDSGSACFPASASVRVAVALGTQPQRFRDTRMDELRLGDLVSVGHGLGESGGSALSDIFFFSHRDPVALSEFVVLHVESDAPVASRGGGEEGQCAASDDERCAGAREDVSKGRSLTLSPGHFVLTRPRGLVLATHVRPGADSLVREDGTAARVVATRRVSGRGLYAPHTLRGSLVVDGFVVSAYTTAVPPAIAHAILAPLRFAYVVFGVTVRGLLDQGSTPGQLAWPRLVRPQTGMLHSHCRRASWGIIGRLVEHVICPFLVIPTKDR